MCGWLNNPSVSEIFLRNSLLLHRDRRPLWKVEMVNLNPLLLLGAGSAVRMADNKHFQCVNPRQDYSSARTSNFPVEGETCAGDTISVGLRLLLYAEAFVTIQSIFSAGVGGGTTCRNLQRCLLLTHAKLF